MAVLPLIVFDVNETLLDLAALLMCEHEPNRAPHADARRINFADFAF